MDNRTNITMGLDRIIVAGRRCEKFLGGSPPVTGPGILRGCKREITIGVKISEALEVLPSSLLLRIIFSRGLRSHKINVLDSLQKLTSDHAKMLLL
jgi:hypothetical protein